MSRATVAVMGMGGIGLAVARRLGNGRHPVVGTRSVSTLDAAVAALRYEGHSVDGHLVDVGDRGSVAAFADAAARAGSVRVVVNAAGVSPATASASEILRVDLLGCVHVIDEFLRVASAGTVLVNVASMAGHTATLSATAEHHLATAAADELLDIDGLDVRSMASVPAYAIAKRANQLRVEAAARQWGARGARVNSVSPGLIATRMGHDELAGPLGEAIRQAMERSPTGRIGTPAQVVVPRRSYAATHRV
jgi:NAD(P)-dependent dehydrogenase (short-subunit alcohol dehydrogenase family)